MSMMFIKLLKNMKQFGQERKRPTNSRVNQVMQMVSSVSITGLSSRRCPLIKICEFQLLTLLLILMQILQTHVHYQYYRRQDNKEKRYKCNNSRLDAEVWVFKKIPQPLPNPPKGCLRELEYLHFLRLFCLLCHLLLLLICLLAAWLHVQITQAPVSKLSAVGKWTGQASTMKDLKFFSK